MRRLNLDDEGGAVTVIVAILLPVLLGMSALVVDVSRVYQERRELQNGADAAALAVAENCARAQAGQLLLVPRCQSATLGASVAGSVQSYMNKNAAPGHPATATTDPSTFSGMTARSVTVRTSAPVSFLFAPVLETFDGELDSRTVTASAKAVWGPAASAPARPIAVARSQYVPNGPANVVIGNDAAAGAFGYLDNDGDCNARTAAGGGLVVGEPLESNDPGNRNPSTMGCSPGDFKGKITIPVYDVPPAGSGNGADYVIVGFTTIQVHSFRFSGGEWCWSNLPVPPSCGGSERYLRGTFVAYVAVGEPVLSDAGAPSFGTVSVSLVNVTN